MGDGKVALILDIAGLSRRGRIEKASEMEGREKSQAAASQATTTLLLLRSPKDGHRVIPLSQVARLEEFERAAVERVGNLNAVRYRDEIMPVVPVLEWLPERRGARVAGDFVDFGAMPEVFNVVVYKWKDRIIGLLVDDILDILDHPFEVQQTAARDGVQGTIVVHDRITEVLDLQRIISLGDPNFFAQTAPVKETVP
jgi:two-component system, chemotaxis family, sensor kinase CheA